MDSYICHDCVQTVSVLHIVLKSFLIFEVFSFDNAENTTFKYIKISYKSYMSM